MKGTISEIKVDQVLIRHAELGCQSLEIGNSTLVQTDRDRLFEFPHVRIPPSFHRRKIVMLSHISPLVPIGLLFLPVGLSGGDDADHALAGSKAMAYDQDPQPITDTQELSENNSSDFQFRGASM